MDPQVRTEGKHPSNLPKMGKSVNKTRTVYIAVCHNHRNLNFLITSSKTECTVDKQLYLNHISTAHLTTAYSRRRLHHRTSIKKPRHTEIQFESEWCASKHSEQPKLRGTLRCGPCTFFFISLCIYVSFFLSL